LGDVVYVVGMVVVLFVYVRELVVYVDVGCFVGGFFG